jgi:hypothetical protein
MSKIDIKESLVNLIANTHDEDLLRSFYELLKTRLSVSDGQLWMHLDSHQKQILKQTVEESNSPEYLISGEDQKKKHKKWL